MGSDPDSGPLKGIKVLELGTLIAGPFCAKTLADFGAEVIKVEPPGDGDPLRRWRRMRNGVSLWWHVQSRNKKSITLDLRQAEGQAIVRRLVRDCDIVIENFRPGALEKWNLGWDALSRENPKLVLVRISGYGQTGPYRERPGFAAIGEAMGGMRYITGFPDRPPVRPNLSVGDTLASLHGVIGALLALHHVQERKPGPGDRRRALRVGVQHHREPAAGVRRARRGARALGQHASRHRAVQSLSVHATAPTCSSPATPTHSSGA